MATQRVLVGTVRLVEGVRTERTRSAEFEGEELAVRRMHINAEGTLGFEETLYYTTDDRLLVHIANWSRQHGEMTIYTMLEATRRDLQAGGRFEALGQRAWAWLRKAS